MPLPINVKPLPIKQPTSILSEAKTISADGATVTVTINSAILGAIMVDILNSGVSVMLTPLEAMQLIPGWRMGFQPLDTSAWSDDETATLQAVIDLINNKLPGVLNPPAPLPPDPVVIDIPKNLG